MSLKLKISSANVDRALAQDLASCIAPCMAAIEPRVGVWPGICMANGTAAP